MIGDMTSSIGLGRMSGKSRSLSTAFAMFLAMGGRNPFDMSDTTYHNAVYPNIKKAWNDISISKKERKGKSYEEIQEARMNKFMIANPDFKLDVEN